MLIRARWGVFMALVLAGCASEEDRYVTTRDGARYEVTDQRLECVPYARQVSGIEIYGNAWTWWNAAQGRYGRGHQPQFLSVLVLQKTKSLPQGHVSVVIDVVGPREIRVTHANWGYDTTTRYRIHESMTVIDVSPANDWTQLRFRNPDTGQFGKIYPAYGFVYGDKKIS